jgi:hypothetical protein
MAIVVQTKKFHFIVKNFLLKVLRIILQMINYLKYPYCLEKMMSQNLYFFNCDVFDEINKYKVLRSLWCINIASYFILLRSTKHILPSPKSACAIFARDTLLLSETRTFVSFSLIAQ